VSRPAPTTPASASSTPAIDLRGVSKRFGRRGRGVTALERADLVVEPGEFVSLVGPSGCGKSTLLRVVGGLLDADAGTVTVVGDSPAQARRDKRFGLVPQEPALLPWRTVRQNVRLLTEVNRKAAGRALGADDTVGLLTEVGLSDFLDAYPQELSGGMQQRVSLVRAFALGAPILLMDEPFAALDEMTREDMRFLLLRLWERSATTIVFVTHHIPEAVVLSDRVLVMSHRPGRIVADERVDLPRPRTTALDETIEFVEHVKRVRRALQQGAAS
jgi:NitT/TauT family transport system ATP-binding protein